MDRCCAPRERSPTLPIRCGRWISWSYNYFAFVTLTTTGYGDIHPVTPQTQMLCVMVAIAGTVYLAMVMGLLISRYTARDVEDQLDP